MLEVITRCSAAEHPAGCRDLNPLYNSTVEASLLFGSGARAGVDRREQKKLAATHKAALMRKMREAQVGLPALLRCHHEQPCHGIPCLRVPPAVQVVS